MSQILAFIGIGSNLDQPAIQVQRAIAALGTLPNSRMQQCSPWYRSAAIGPGEQADYINGVAALETGLSAIELLDQLQAIEQAQGRVRTVRWGPRSLDLDLLLYGNQRIDSDRLIVPHPRLQDRHFVLYPLYDLAPDLSLPDGSSVRELLRRVDQAELRQVNLATQSI